MKVIIFLYSIICFFLNNSNCRLIIYNNIYEPNDINSSQPCKVPDKLNDNLIIEDYESELILKPGQLVAQNTILKYSCPSNYSLSSEFDANVCLDGDWLLQDHPNCLKMCPPIERKLLRTTCTYNRIYVSCDDYMKPGTISKVNCEEKLSLSWSDKIPTEEQCKTNGEWEAINFKCNQKKN